ncbi:oxidoreductase [Congregibacter sp.]|uniref:oxidoreductase n=1 Tax=Congregibacter sp. TaxID=2744308 RepID=UPI003F6A8AF4
MRQLLLAGATGLVGQAILSNHDPSQLKITTVGRRATQQVADEIITDFVQPVTLPPADMAISALGTTIASAGSKAAFRAVDYDAVLRFAQSALAAGANHFVVVTSVGADPKARVFYARVKGEVEDALQAMNFRRLDILQPGLLLGDRRESRPVETLMRSMDPVTRLFLKGPLDRYAGIGVTTVGSALLALCKEQEPGVYRHGNRSIHHLAGL